ncbi:hypothetical protein PENSTE_c017G10253 [Penicillium steckii]|uniref:Acetyl-coenzyme A synthetase n=1 Tax=Penicillium steckii TaxID=303698 RepID=A0A1V6SX72_9EURO|nr:hypothetical protein PENSTE_c017G10253 [Penicillium steckii]
MTKLAANTIEVDAKWRSRHPTAPHLAGLDEFQSLYQDSIHNPSQFWAKQARELLSFDRDFHTTTSGSFHRGDAAWFLGGQLNACFNCVDRHAIQDPNRVGIIYEPDDPANDCRSITYGELLAEICQLAGFLRSQGVKKGDIVTIYMPMIPEAAIAVLACTRIGAVHSVVFAGFSAGALRDRIQDAKSTVIITTDEGRRGGKTISTKVVVDEAVRENHKISTVLVYERTGGQIPWMDGRDFRWKEEIQKYPAYISPEGMDSEDPLFLLYTSGSTGKPKGLLHTHAGYLLGASVTGKYVFDLNPQDRFFCSGDIGWITGHTYVVYAPLLLGSTTVMFEGTPTYPNHTRLWDVLEKHQATHFYGAPTSFRVLKALVDKADVENHDLSKLRALGSVGEPIAPEIWKWYHSFMGDGNACVTDTYWQTETGSHIIAAYTGVTPMKPGSASFPCFGIDVAILDPTTGEELQGNSVEGVLAVKKPWPSMARTIRGNHDRYLESYFNTYNGYYFTGDGAYRDADGYYWIRGRVDDVINVSGHRLSTSEIESALVEHESVAEAAIIGVPDDLTGQAVNTVVSLKSKQAAMNIEKELILQIRKVIGPFAAPKRVIILPDLPKTRSGKTVRRILRKALSGDTEFGDTSTLADPSVIDELTKILQKADQ